MISQTAEYALRALIWLASRPDEQLSARQVAKATKVPAGYLAKVLQNLARAELLASQRGVGGGFMLAHAPEDISIWRIVDAVDPIKRIRSCPLDIKSHGVNLCPLHSRIDATIALVQDAFESTTLADLLNETSGSPPLCEFPRSSVVKLAPPKRPSRPTKKTPARRKKRRSGVRN